MAYPYICQACLDGRHAECEVSRDKPPAGAIGGGFCACQHGPPEARSAFEQELFERDVVEA